MKVFVIEAVKRKGAALNCTPSELKNEDILLEAVKECGEMFEYTSDYFKYDRQMVMKTVQQGGFVSLHALLN